MIERRGSFCFSLNISSNQVSPFTFLELFFLLSYYMYYFGLCFEFLSLTLLPGNDTCAYISLVKQGTWPCLSFLGWNNIILPQYGDPIIG